MYIYAPEKLDKKHVEALAADLSKDNEYITETAGYIPLEVKFKQFEQNGIVAQFMGKDFTSTDYRNIYLNPDFDITPEDDLEDIQEKIVARNDFMKSIQERKSKVGSLEETANSPSGSAAADKKKSDEKKSETDE